jgi:UDP-N-acetylmuramyl pentapeptide phosphotransferase/UDP-N-acetylglucosamine-1-phosphate transferase
MQIDALPSPYVAGLLALGSAVVCAAILGLLLKTGLAWWLATDIPNDRSLHTRPTPRVGGWGVVPVVLAVIISCGSHTALEIIEIFVDGNTAPASSVLRSVQYRLG